MVDACRRNLGLFDDSPHFVHQVHADFGIAFILDNSTDAVQVEPNRIFNDFDVHDDTLGHSICYGTITRYFSWMPKKDSKPKVDPWFTYILRCVDGSLYTGITKNVERRCQLHKAGTASRYTR